MIRILVMGLPNSGKSQLAKQIYEKLSPWKFDIGLYDADDVRKDADDWDFSNEGRERQSKRMFDLCNQHDIGIANFICPTQNTRKIFDADISIWMDTKLYSKYKDTNAIFEKPEGTTFVVKEQSDNEVVLEKVGTILDMMFESRIDWQKETALLVGRFQPFHDGHLELVKKSLAKTDQCCIIVRNTHELDENNPYDFSFVRRHIHRKLYPDYKGRYTVMQGPNITNIVYGRDPGYGVEQIKLTPDLEEISATEIRKELE